MCDYSLMHLPNRLACEGESLVVYRFARGSKGCVSPEDLRPKVRSEFPRKGSFSKLLKKLFRPARIVTAVCIPPGAQLKLTNLDAAFQREYHVQSEEEVTFEQLSEEAYTYRDAISFRNGSRVLLQDLRDGQSITVLTLGPQHAPDSIHRGGLELVKTRPLHRTRASW